MRYIKVKVDPEKNYAILITQIRPHFSTAHTIVEPLGRVKLGSYNSSQTYHMIVLYLISLYFQADSTNYKIPNLTKIKVTKVKT